MSNPEPLSRRRFLQRLTALGAAGLGGTTLLAACGGGDQPASGTSGTTSDASFSCTDTSGLTEQEIQMRESLQYVDQTPIEGKVCDNCEFWVPPEGDAQCGGCQLIKGPIHPDGYCTSWVAQSA